MKYNWEEERVKDAVANALYIRQALQNLGVPDIGCNYRTLKAKIKLYNIDTSHFDKHAQNHAGKHQLRLIKNRTNEDIFKQDSKIKRDNLKKVYIERILQREYCEECGIGPIWNGKILVFQIHHIDGNRTNNVISNLKLLCPNCHSQTENYSNRKREEV